jgi:hypothetical protein
MLTSEQLEQNYEKEDVIMIDEAKRLFLVKDLEQID